jgi:hypothetical protein
MKTTEENKRNYRYLDDLLKRSVETIYGVSGFQIEVVRDPWDSWDRPHDFIVRCLYDYQVYNAEPLEIRSITVCGFEDEWKFRQELMLKLPTLYGSIIQCMVLPK